MTRCWATTVVVAADPTIAPVTASTVVWGRLSSLMAACWRTKHHAGQYVGQVLSATSGVSVLSDAGGVAGTFHGTLAEFARELLTAVSVKDLTEITDLGGTHAIASYAAAGDAGVLTVSNGTQSGMLHLSGQLTGPTFHATSDGHGSSLIALP